MFTNIALIIVVCVNFALVLSSEVQLTCIRSEGASLFSSKFECSIPIEDGSEVTVGSTDIDFEAIREEDPEKRIFIEISGDENYPENIPDGLGKVIDGIEIFSYQKTPLKHLKRSDFTDMSSKLLKVMLERNQIESIEPETFHDLTKLFFLSLAYNKLKEIPTDLLHHSPQLSMLIIRENEITELNPAILKNSPKLKKFFASKNQISELDPELFATNPDMMIIGMRGNKIKNIPFDFREFNSLYIADFLNNEDGCDTIYNVNELTPKYCDEECQGKTIKNIDEFQLKIEEVCRN